MSCPDPAAKLLAFLANGTLDETQRLQVEAHVAGCDECRRLLGLARAAREQMRDPEFDPEAHVQAQLLAEYVDRPEALEVEPRAWVASHLQACDVCASAVTTLRSMAAPPQTLKPERGSRGLWSLLAGTILRPLPALAYLLVAAAGLTWIARTPGPAPLPPQPPAGLLPAPVSIREEISMRGGGNAPEPVRVPVKPGGPVRLALQTDLDPEDTAPGAPPLHLALRRGETTLWSTAVAPDSIPPDGVLEVVLQPGALPLAVPLELTLTAGTGGGRTPLFARSIVLEQP